jgi:hypothetical protein
MVWENANKPHSGRSWLSERPELHRRTDSIDENHLEEQIGLSDSTVQGLVIVEFSLVEPQPPGPHQRNY